MNWHFWNKTIFRKLAMLLSTIMVVALICGANLFDAKGLTSRQEINHFIEVRLIREITVPYNILFCVLIAVGMTLFLVGWKWYGKKIRAGILLNNIATGYLATVFLGYGLTTILAIKALSWEVVYSFVVSVVLYALLTVNIICRTQVEEASKSEKEDKAEGTDKSEKEDKAEETDKFEKKDIVEKTDKELKCAVISAVVALIISIVVIGIFVNIYNFIYDASYKEYKKIYSDSDYGFIAAEPDYRDYVRLQFVNYFNQEDEYFTYEELEESIENYNNDSGSWYSLWYCINYLRDINRYNTTNQINFSGYGYDDEPQKGYLNFVINQLRAQGIYPNEATREELDAACKHVYEVYTNRESVVVLGDEEGEIVIHIDVPESGNVEQVEVTWENQGYYAFVSDWYEVSSVGQGESKDADPVQAFEEGKIYYTQVNYNFAIPYVSSDRQNVQIDVTGGQLLIDELNDREPIDIWIMPGNTN